MRRFLLVIVVFIIILTCCESQAKSICIRSGKPIQEQLTEANAVYLIKGRIDLNGTTVIMPSNSTLKFKRKGQLTNGTLQGNGTYLTGKPRFDEVRLTGKYATQEFYASWSSACSMSDYIEDVMNLGGESTIVVDCDITLNDEKRYVDHLKLKGKKKTITNSDRYYITYGGTNISDLKFHWNKGPVQVPKDNYSAVVIYWDLLQKDTTITTSIRNVEADGGRYCSYFMKQYKSSIEPQLSTRNLVENSSFDNFTRGVIWTCGGTGRVTDCYFRNIGYENTSSLLSVYPLRLGYSNNVGERGKAMGYEVRDCEFNIIVASYNSQNDGRELHGLLAFGDSIVVKDNRFCTLSTNFTRFTDPGMDSEMLYIKGSYNTIEDNYFENGAGSLSDGVVTMKVGGTEGNTIINNTFYTSNTYCRFIYLGGINHIIENNIFNNTYSLTSFGDNCAIYLSHHEMDSGNETTIIRNNSFSFMKDSKYMAVYANWCGPLYLENNKFENPTKLIKCNNRNGAIFICDNYVYSHHIQGDDNDVFISLTIDNDYSAVVSGNVFSFSNSQIGKLMVGANYVFNDNQVFIENTKMHSLLRGENTRIEVKGNSVSLFGAFKLQRDAFVGELSSDKIILENNHFNGSLIKETIIK